MSREQVAQVGPVLDRHVQDVDAVRSGARPSSSAEQTIPAEAMPRRVAASIRRPPVSWPPGADVRHLGADEQVGGARHDCLRAAFPDVESGDGELVGIRVRLQADDRGDVDPLPVVADLDDVLDLGPGHVQAVDKLVQRQRDVHQLAQPAQWHFHETNCSRNRGSLA